MQIKVFIDSDSEVNVINLTYTAILGLMARLTNIDVQKINGSALKTYGMTSTRFSLQDS